MKVLVTGGAGYIGSHTVVELINSGHETVIVDNLYNSHIEVLDKIEKITNVRPVFYEADVCDKETLINIFKEHKFDGIIHFAGYKAVGESVQLPLKYYYNNLLSTIVLSEVAEQFNVNTIVFSSSATVYHSSNTSPLKEGMAIGATNPYGQTKIVCEQILTDLCVANKNFSAILLRYFNPIGAHSSGLIGEEPVGIPNNLMPYICQVAVGKLDELKVFGDDYDTVDGTGVRDYIHVVDLAKGHVKALEKKHDESGVHIYNLGTGNGFSVLQLVNAFEKANNIKIPYTIVGRRAGDIATVYSSSDKARVELGWEAKENIEEMCRSSWKFQENIK